VDSESLRREAEARLAAGPLWDRDPHHFEHALLFLDRLPLGEAPVLGAAVGVLLDLGASGRAVAEAAVVDFLVHAANAWRFEGVARQLYELAGDLRSATDRSLDGSQPERRLSEVLPLLEAAQQQQARRAVDLLFSRPAIRSVTLRRREDLVAEARAAIAAGTAPDGGYFVLHWLDRAAGRAAWIAAEVPAVLAELLEEGEPTAVAAVIEFAELADQGAPARALLARAAAEAPAWWNLPGPGRARRPRTLGERVLALLATEPPPGS
jgi:hypothetical protein